MPTPTISASKSVLKNWKIAAKDGRVSDGEIEKIVKAAKTGGITSIEKKQAKDVYLKAKRALNFSTPANNGKLLKLFRSASVIYFIINHGQLCLLEQDMNSFGAALACLNELGFLSKNNRGWALVALNNGKFGIWGGYSKRCRKGRSAFSSGFKSNNKRKAMVCAIARSYGEGKKYIYKPCFSTNKRTSPFAPWCSMPKRK